MKFLLFVVILRVGVQAQLTPSCSVDPTFCATFDNTVCSANSFTEVELDAFNTRNTGLPPSPCLCDFDYTVVVEDGTFAGCEDSCVCDVDNTHATSQPPQWDLESSGFGNGTQDLITFAIKRSECYDTVQYAFGNGPINDSDWEDWEGVPASGANTAKTEDCFLDVSRTLVWYQDKESVIKAVHDPESPMFLTQQHGDSSLARVPLTDANVYTSQYGYANEFIVYDGCLNTREVTTFNISIANEEFEIVRHVDNVLKFKIEFPTRLEICANVTLEVVEIEEVLVNQSVYCTEDGKFAAQLEFETFVTWPYVMNETEYTATVDEDCFDLNMTSTGDSGCLGTDKTVCAQTWALQITPKGGAVCDDVCTIDGQYDFSMNLEPREGVNASDIHPNYPSTSNFTFDVQSADFCSQVIAEADVSQEMEAYHDANRTDGDTVFFVNDKVYLEAVYTSSSASIAEIDELSFKVTNLNTGVEYVLYASTNGTSGNTLMGNTSMFAFATTDDEFDTNPYLVWPEFNLTDDVFDLTDNSFPVVLESCLEVNVTFFGNRNDGTSGDATGLDNQGPVDTQAPGDGTDPGDGTNQGGTLVELLNMIDNTKFQTTQIRTQFLLLPDRSIEVIKEFEPEAVPEEKPAIEKTPESVSALSIVTFVLAAILFVALALYAAYVVSNKNKYTKIATQVDAPQHRVL